MASRIILLFEYVDGMGGWMDGWMWMECDSPVRPSAYASGSASASATRREGGREGGRSSDLFTPTPPLRCAARSARAICARVGSL